jgi:hypothetical protein
MVTGGNCLLVRLTDAKFTFISENTKYFAINILVSFPESAAQVIEQIRGRQNINKIPPQGTYINRKRWLSLEASWGISAPKSPDPEVWRLSPHSSTRANKRIWDAGCVNELKYIEVA